jgi:hypothetical protein
MENGGCLLGTILERERILAQSFSIDLRESGFPDLTFGAASADPATGLGLPLAYTLLDRNDSELAAFSQATFRHGPDMAFTWQFLAQDPGKFIVQNYLWVWPSAAKSKALILRFRNESPHLVEIQSGYRSIRHDILIEERMLVIRARVAGPFP